jgi:hypothetical protein
MYPPDIELPDIAVRQMADMRAWVKRILAFQSFGKAYSTLAISFMAALSIAFSFLVVAKNLAIAQSGKPTAISGTLISVDDRLAPFEVKNIVSEQNFVFTLSGVNNVTESVKRAVTHTSTMREGKILPGPTIERNANLGQAASKVMWRVEGPHKLRRVAEGKQMILIMDFSIDTAGNCAVTAKFLLQKGYTDIIATRFDNGQEAHFSLPKVVSATCKVE